MKKNVKCIYMGTPDFAVKPLEAIINAGYEVISVVTQPDKPKGRSAQLQYPPVKQTAIDNGIMVAQPNRARDEEFVEQLKKLSPDIIVVAAYGQILPQSILDIPRLGCINIHASLLPKYRGAAPIQWSIIDGEEYTGITTMRMEAGVDTGDIIEQIKVKLDENETGGSLFDKLADMSKAIIISTMDKLVEGTATFTKQDESKSTHAKMLTKDLGQLDFTQEAIKLERLIRGLNPWPSAYIIFKGKTLKIWEAKAVNNSELNTNAQAGTITNVTKDYFEIATKDGSLRILELQLEGKKRMSSKDFMLGNKLLVGDKFE